MTPFYSWYDSVPDYPLCRLRVKTPVLIGPREEVNNV